MVKVTTNYLIRRIIFRKQLQVRKKDETDRQYLNRITHLRLQSQYIDQIGKIKDCQSVLVIYLQCNILKTIHNFENFPNLIHLYLQRNLLTKIENLDALQRLRKLYLGYNEIVVLEGLENLHNIVELHIESQDRPRGETLYFEPRTVHNLAVSLRILNVSGNSLTTLRGLNGLMNLEILIACDNCLKDLKDVTTTLSTWTVLKQLNLTGNVITQEKKYYDSVVYACDSLEQLDERKISDHTKQFIKHYLDSKGVQLNHRLKTNITASSKKEAGARLRKQEDRFPNFPECAPVSQSGQPTWKLRKNLNPGNGKFFTPRPYRKKSLVYPK